MFERHADDCVFVPRAIPCGSGEISESDVTWEESARAESGRHFVELSREGRRFLIGPFPSPAVAHNHRAAYANDLTDDRGWTTAVIEKDDPVGAIPPSAMPSRL